MASAQAERQRQLEYHLAQVIACLSQVSRGEHSVPARHGSSWWYDEQYLYNEFGPLDEATPNLDLAICDGRVFIRIER